MKSGGAIAIIGMGCRFPGSPGVAEFWRTIRDGRTCFSEVPRDRWDHQLFHSANPREPDKSYARKVAVVGDLRPFAPEWFGVPPRRARLMDPQQRVLLEASRHALDDAGYGFGARPMPRATGVFVGASVSEHKDLVTSRMRAPLLWSGAFGQRPDLGREARRAALEDLAPMQAYSMVGQLLNMIACNVSQAFDWGGPAFATDAACSSALVALAEAVHHLRAGSCDAALVGGVYTIVGPDNLVAFSRIGALSRTDACRPFDERADGFVLGEGVGVVVLKRLEDALREGDRIRAVVLGLGVTNDGRGEGPMTPRLEGQVAALDRAYRAAAVSPDTVGYVEAHGTATPVGDAIEVTGLKQYFQANRQGPIDCAVASVKGNIGHTLAAAGAAGLIRATLALEAATIPPQAGFAQARAALDLGDSGLSIPRIGDKARPFPAGPGGRRRRRAAVSAFGFGGTNVHVILEEAPPAPSRRVSIAVPDIPARPELFVLSAPTPALLAEHIQAVRTALASDRPGLADVAFTLAVTRRREDARVAFVAASQAELDRKLEVAAQVVATGTATAGIWFAKAPVAAGVAFLYPGQGAQTPGLCHDLYQRFPAFRARLDELAATLDGRLPRPLLEYLFGPEADMARLTATEVCQPVLAALELALTDFAAELGLTPTVTVGHSLGELIAAAAGGILAPLAALSLVAFRGRLMSELGLTDDGAMAAITADLATVEALVPRAPSDQRNAVVVANVNHPNQVVVSGAKAALEILMEKAEAQGLRVTRLPVSHAFHSGLMEGVASGLAPVVEQLDLRPPRAPVISCIEGAPYSSEPETVRRTFVRHATARVDFVTGVRKLWDAGGRILVQVGAGTTLCAMARQTLAVDGHTPLAAVTLADSDSTCGSRFLETLGELTAIGVPLSLAPLWAGEDVRVASLPSTPLHERAFWVVASRHPQESPPLSSSDHAAARPVPGPLAVGPDGVEPKVLDFVAQVSAFPRSSLRADLRLGRDLGFDSLMAVDLSVHIAETWPEVGQLPRALLGGETTIGEVAKHVVKALGKREAVDPPLPARIALRRHVLSEVPRPAPEPPPGAQLIFAAPVIVVADGLGVAPLLAERLARIGCEARVVAPDSLPPSCRSVVDLRWVAPRGHSLPTVAELREPVMSALHLARAMGQPSAFVAAHTGLGASGITGFAKAAAREWPDALVKSVALAPDMTAQAMADAVCTELMTSDRTVEVRWNAQGRSVAESAPQPLSGTAALRQRVVVAISGGSRGLGAKLGLELARRYQARLALLGRTAADPMLIDQVKAAGGEAAWVACDVREPSAVTEALAEARRVFGPIEVLIHAAGIVADGPLVTKDDESFGRVFDTKVAGAMALWQALANDPLNVVLFTSSWAGRFGNGHQTDYAAANHVLGQLSTAFSAARPEVRVVALDLPPWEGTTMVSALPDTVRRAMRSRVPFVDDAEGLPLVMAELEGGQGEILVAPTSFASPREDRTALILSAGTAPWLADHQVGGAPVWPMAAAIDQAVAAALRLGLATPLTLEGFELEDGVTVATDTRVEVRASVTERGATVEISHDEGKPAYRTDIHPAEASLPALDLPEDGKPSELSLDEFYGQHTFHGPRLRAVTRVAEIGPAHVAGSVRTGSGELGAAALDVLALDGCLQLCAYWATVVRGRLGLPLGIDELRLCRPMPRAGELSVLGVLENDGGEALRGHLDVRDAAGELVVQVRGLRTQLLDRAVVDAAPVRPCPCEDSFKIEAFPEVVDLRQRIAMARAVGMENPYFHVHERVTHATTIIGGRELINFASYNYLGLSGHDEVTQAAMAALSRYGTSVSASRVASGEKPLHRELEEAIARFLGCEDAIVMVGGHATNVSVIGHLLGPQDLVLHDSLAHDSILGGVRLSGAKRRPFPHNDAQALDELLGQLRPTARRVLIAVEGVYSMDGDIAPLAELIAVKKRHKALLLVDEAHSLGVLGQTGRGVGEHFSVSRSGVELWMGTLSKSLASCGGYIAGSAALVEYLKYTNPGFIYSVGISPANAAAALAALRVLEASPDKVALLRERSSRFVQLLRERGIDTGMSEGSAVIPCIVGSSWDCLKLSQALKERGINVQPILYPAVEENLARLRFFITARHTEEQLSETADILAEELGRLSPSYLNRGGRPRDVDAALSQV